jgi:hypothetical protein
MPDWEGLLKKAKEDVLCAVDIWVSILQETFGSRLEYAYAKGSALKQWDSFVDYVPVVSDLDMHIMLTDSDDMFPNDAAGFSSSIDVARKFEERFPAERPDHLHFPRAQIVHINPNLDDDSFILPQISEVYVMVGNPRDGPIRTDEEVRKQDLKKIQDMTEYIEDLPRQAVDRVGLDFWSLLRRMSWRVSPSPVRLLSQVHSSPSEVWKWNRTRITEELRNYKYDAIADSYHKYYKTGWELFLSSFSDYSKLREIVTHGYHVLRGCADEV